MVTIDPDKTVMNIADLKKRENQTVHGEKEFGSVFQDVITTSDAQPLVSESVSSLSEIRPAQFNVQTEAAETGIVDHVQQLLDTMEIYQQQLGSRSTSLKEIEPVLEKMDSQNESLAEMADATGVDDDLKTIINQSLTLSSIEIARYRSGQYNDE
ncbi:hypothetical protein [Desulfosarcina ovata]|uniref:Uncharacterized protein n=2 Tax=Desulfosarcina ovata TaxID=83564 RepID=A0A5K8A532_9BACT|nr:hypothetical protein [Desulfosarcina ovata]BBO80303.1 hypothetical protein DSCO28_08690 [Desulfosarcina ovata subsp. sediminis]BBO87693.1 hypothetical protein DSCOOX_08730 [Desulfosarcina ovata subsp. ovata]